MREILFLAHRAPWWPDRGDRIRSHHVLAYLAARARVHVVTLDEEGAPPPAVLAATLASWTVVRRTKTRARAAAEALATGRPLSLTAFAHGDVSAAVAKLVAERPIGSIYVFSGQMAQYLPADGPPAIVDFVDVDSAKFAQLADGAHGPMRWMLAREARLLAAFERGVARRAAASLFVSEAEAAVFRAGGAAGRVVAVPNGVDAAAFDPGGVVPEPLAGQTIVFTGQMDYAPNVEAVTRFAHRILPIVRGVVPDAQFAIVGRAPTAAVRALASDHITVTGAVADTRPWLAAAAVCVAPLSLARGVQNKVLEAMAMARPVVASAAAAEGIDHGGTIRIADDDACFAGAVMRLLGDRIAANDLGAAARRQVQRRYDWAACLAPLDGLIGLTSSEARAA